MPKVPKKQLPFIMASLAYVVCCKISKLFISAIIVFSDSGWALQCTCYGIYTHNTVPSRATSPPFSPVLYSRFQHATQPLLRGIQTRETGVCRVSPTHSNGCVTLTPFQPTACICISLCTNSIVLQALRERYNAYRCPLVAL